MKMIIINRHHLHLIFCVFMYLTNASLCLSIICSNKEQSKKIFKSPLMVEDKIMKIYHTEMFIDHFISIGYNYSDPVPQDVITNDIPLDHKREHINNFIDDNKAMIKRMLGEYREPSSSLEHYHTYDGISLSKNLRNTRSIRKKFLGKNKVDICESIVEIVTPYWASNSGGKIRAIVNTQHLQQAIQQEVCRSTTTGRCKDDCNCEQKYKWHRLLAYDPSDDCKGIFMDWFLFPSGCVCRCII